MTRRYAPRGVVPSAPSRGSLRASTRSDRGPAFDPAGGSLAPVATSLTPCPTCARETQTLENQRCEYCGQRKPIPAEPTGAATAARPAPSLWSDLRRELVAAAIGLTIALIGLVTGSTLLLVVAAVILVGSAVRKIVADGW
jgi:hypothetical protein